MRIKVIEKSKADEQKKLKVCAYCRVSTNTYEQGQSLENQTLTYERLIRSNPEYEFSGIYHDKAVTGSKEERPGFQKMLSDARQGMINLIITKSISRFARNTTTVLKYTRELKAMGIAVYFEEENINTLSEDGELMLSVLSSFAQEELRSISENLKWSVQRKFKQGILKMSTTYFLGYDMNEYGELVINEEQAKIVRRIFKMYLDGMGTDSIAKRLNEENILTIKNNKWSGTTINCILKNEKYKGDCLLQKTYCPEINKRKINNGEVPSYYVKEDHQPIVSREDWDKVQEIREERKKQRNMTNSEKYTNRYPLSGMLICPYCGSKLSRKHVHNNRIEWWCSKSIKEGVNACKGVHVRDEEATEWNITEPTVVKEEIINGKKHYSYTRKSELDNNEPKPNSNEVENGGILPSVNRPRRAIIKL